MNECSWWDMSSHKWAVARVDVKYTGNSIEGSFNKTFHWQCSICGMPAETSKR